MKNYTDGEGIFLFWQLQVFFKTVCHLLSGTLVYSCYVFETVVCIYIYLLI